MFKHSLLVASLTLSLNSLFAQNYVLPLWTDENIPNYQSTDETEIVVYNNGMEVVSLVQKPNISVYLPSKKNSTGKAIVICPGGGYHVEVTDWEGTDIAKWFNSKGIAAIVLKYRLPFSKSNIIPHKSPLLDAKRAIRLVRHHADEWYVNKNEIGIMGFSAGGHLASTLGTHFDYGVKESPDKIDTLSSRPDFMILMYPVISFKNQYGHIGSKNALIGDYSDTTLVDYFSSEVNVKTDTPPTILIHSTDDKSVHVKNSLMFYEALVNKNVSAEMHIYPYGGHGFSLAIGKGYLQTWTNRVFDWLDNLKL
ncbi:MAG: alpha/beta hydrolase [Ignavibacteriae bacterium]|nr:alpha/beta hydrolase [Ignavibacteriota bacterium]